MVSIQSKVALLLTIVVFVSCAIRSQRTNSSMRVLCEAMLK
jgi:hypothetical protein